MVVGRASEGELRRTVCCGQEVASERECGRGGLAEAGGGRRA